MKYRGLAIQWNRSQKIIQVFIAPGSPDFSILLKSVRAIPERVYREEQRLWEIPWTLENEIRLHESLGTPTPTIKRYLEPMRAELRRRRYSRRTVRTYLAFNRRFLVFHRKAPAEITPADVRAYLEHLAGRNLAAATMNLAISGLKFFYDDILGRYLFASVVRPKPTRSLPVVLSIQEVLALIKAPTNRKHRALLAVTYSAGLRVSEAVTLRWRDLDRGRKMIAIRKGKGDKDRYSLLSLIAIQLLDDYIRDWPARPLPADWVFPGQPARNHIAVRTAEKIFENARQKSGILKDISIHSLRHAFATHLLESGVDIRYIQKLLGHRSTRTTQIYTHVSRSKLFEINSPLDRLTPEEEE